MRRGMLSARPAPILWITWTLPVKVRAGRLARAAWWLAARFRSPRLGRWAVELDEEVARWMRARGVSGYTVELLIVGEPAWKHELVVRLGKELWCRGVNAAPDWGQAQSAALQTEELQAIVRPPGEASGLPMMHVPVVEWSGWTTRVLREVANRGR